MESFSEEATDTFTGLRGPCPVTTLTSVQEFAVVELSRSHCSPEAAVISNSVVPSVPTDFTTNWGTPFPAAIFGADGGIGAESLTINVKLLVTDRAGTPLSVTLTLTKLVVPA